MSTQIHASKSRFVSDVYIGSALVDMYSKCRNVVGAQKVFDVMIEDNVVSWNTLVNC